MVNNLAIMAVRVTFWYIGQNSLDIAFRCTKPFPIGDNVNAFFFLFFVRRKEGNVLFNDALNTFYLRLYGVMDIVKDHSDSKGYFICIIPQTG